MTFRRHHYVPAFLLREWENGDDGKLTHYRWAMNRLIDSRLKAQSVAFEEHLYSTGVSEGRPDSTLERDFMGPKVDDPASIAHKVVLAKGVGALNDQHKIDWARFIVAQMIRTPKQIADLRRRGRNILMRGNEPVASELLEPGEREVTLAQWLTEHEPGMFDDLAILSLPDLVNSELLNGLVLKATWATREIKHARFDFLLSDTPLVHEGQMTSEFILALPISPRKIFVAYAGAANGEKFKRSTADSLALRANVSQAEQADVYVYSTNSKQRRFVERYLRHASSNWVDQPCQRQRRAAT